MRGGRSRRVNARRGILHHRFPGRSLECATPHRRSTTIAVKTLEELFVHQLSDIYSAEKQLTKALPRLARAAAAEELSAAFEAHLEETRGQVEDRKSTRLNSSHVKI